MILKVKKLDPRAILPVKAGTGDAGFDIRSMVTVALPPVGHAFWPTLVDTGLAIEIPPGYCMVFKDRSSLGLKGIHVLGGVIDSSYRGPLKVILVNLSGDGYMIDVGDKVAQGLILPVPAVDVVECETLSETLRDTGGFGSTGK